MHEFELSSVAWCPSVYAWPTQFRYVWLMKKIIVILIPKILAFIPQICGEREKSLFSSVPTLIIKVLLF